MRTSFGAQWEPISKRALRERLKTDRYHGGLLEPQAFHFHPLKYALGIAHVLTGAQVRIYERSAALGIVRERDRYRVSTAGGSITARHVVFTGGGYAHGVHRRVERAVLPIATYVVTTEPLGNRLKDAVDCDAAVYDTRFAFDYYRALPDTRILWGGRISILDRGAEPIARLLKRDMLKVYPELADVKVDYAWGGLMSYARHQMPQIGRLPDGCWHALGFGGHGVGPTTAAGELLADAIAAGAPIPRGFADYGLPRVWGKAGMLAAQMTYNWAEFKDWING